MRLSRRSTLTYLAGLCLLLASTVAPASSTGAVGYVPERVELEQNWDDETRERFWYTSQGARILPYAWFLHLEQAGSETLFRDGDHMERLRYLPQAASELNPGGLPIGFALADERVACAWYDRDCDGDDLARDWVGLTCAACHTNQLDYQGTHYLIEGAPTLADFVGFLRELIDAMERTGQDDAKFERFARGVLGASYDSASAQTLRAQLEQLTQALALRQQVNALPAGYPEDFTSHARLDAFGNIQNAASAFALGDPTNSNPPTAPVSYPFLWGTHQSNVVQWNGSAANTPVIGPLVRNVGEVFGVFGDVHIEAAPAYLFWRDAQYSSTVDMTTLGELECMVKELRSPAWPAAFPPIDAERAAAGQLLYDRHCVGCHQVIPRADEGERYDATMVPIATVGTDPATARNAIDHMAQTLALEDTHEYVLAGDRFGAEAPAIKLAVNGVIGVVLNDPATALRAGIAPELCGDGGADAGAADLESLVRTHAQEREALADAGPRYKARPLNGIWATAPFLHNGSVPSLAELLKPAAERVTEFHVGSREFDPVNVGYRTDEGPSLFRVMGDDGEPRPGNDNSGHEFWDVDFTDEERMALVEYLKTL